MANQSQSPLPPLTTAAAREEVRPWDRVWTIPGSVDVGLEEELGLEVGHKNKLSQVEQKTNHVMEGGNKNGPR